MFIAFIILLSLAVACCLYARKVIGTARAALLLTVKVAAGVIAISYYLLVVGDGDLFLYEEKVSYYLTAIESGYPMWDFLFMEADPAGQATPQDRTLFFVKILTLLYEPLARNIWLVNVFFSLISFFSAFYFIRQCRSTMPGVLWTVIVLSFFWPTIAVWGGGLSKESLMLSCMFLFLGSVIPRLNGNAPWLSLNTVLAGIALLVLVRLRLFVMLVLLPVLLLWYLTDRLRTTNRPAATKWVAGVAGVVVVAAAAGLLAFSDYSFRPSFLVKAFQFNHAAIVASSSPENIVLGLGDLRSDWVILPQFLLAVAAGILGPFPWEVSSWWEALLMLEPVALLLLFFTNKPGRSAISAEVWIFAIAYVVAVAGFITLSSPNYGSLSRYRLAFYPLLILLATYGHPWLSRLSLAGANGSKGNV